MKLKKVEATGFKGPDFEYELGDLTAFFGRNFRGKSRVMDAIRVGLIGYLPELGKQNKDTWGLASASEMTVRLTFDNGLVIFRSWKLSGNSVKGEHQVPPELEHLAGMSVMFNAEEYFGLTDRKRVEYVFAHCSNATELPDVWGRIRRLLNEQNAEKHDEVDRWVKAVERQLEEKTFGSAQEFIEGQIEVVTDVYKTAKASATRAEKTIQGLTEMRLRDEAGESLQSLEDHRAVMDHDLSELRTQLGEIKGQHARMISDRNRRDVLDRDLARGDRLRTDLAAAMEKLEKAEQPDEVTAADVASSHERRMKAASEVKQVKSEIARLDVEENKIRAQIEGLDGQQTCPYCGAAGDGWKALKTAELITSLDDVVKRMVVASRQLAEAEQMFAETEEKHSALLHAQKVFGEYLAFKDQLVGAINNLKMSIDMLVPKAEERDRLVPNDPELTTNVEMLTKQIQLKEEEISAINVLIKTAQGRAFELRRLADAEKERDEARLETDLAAAAGKELRVIQGEIVERAFAPLLERANSFFSDVLKSPLAYNAAEGGEIGTWRDGQWVGHKTFSGTEKALTYAAIQAALVMDSGFKLIMVDELGRLDDENLGNVLQAFGRAVECGWIDGFVGIDAGRADFYRNFLPRTSGLIIHEIS